MDHCHQPSYESNGPIPRSPSHVVNRPMLLREIDSGVGVHSSSEVVATVRGLDQSRSRRQAGHPLGDQRGVSVNEFGQAGVAARPAFDDSGPTWVRPSSDILITSC
jgi:hypothetical protein